MRVNYLAAQRGPVDAGALRSGETLAIIGAGAGVGSAVAQIARRRGQARSLAWMVGPRPGLGNRKATDAFIAGASETAAAVRKALGGSGADVVFDAVGPCFVLRWPASRRRDA
ncbi:hypothetical protein MES5069_680006 [Mesorhizobium escarrei]|uniref:Alcohol dehydrogenase-like C-terminal domain-containing protein n=1 Tax=Mesorhizobium escarrei TaxID=666018 RepID=A0ABM9EG21_9HYPH|nr:hypothetical protein MES5069_680006 [Mesorhizobium escarrei]